MNHSRKPFIRNFHDSITIRTRGYLPHWEASAGGIYLVTFRLADALPRAAIDRLIKERQELLLRFARERQRQLTWMDRLEVNRLFTLRIDRYLDAGSGACELRDPRAAQIVATALRFFDGERYRLISWTVMPNHVHCIIEPKTGWNLATILHSWKSYSAKEINKLYGRKGRLWQEEYFDHLIRSEEDLRELNAYVLDNPRRSGLKDWPWVSARVDEWK